MRLERCRFLLLYASTNRVLLQDTRPEGPQSVVHFGLTPSFSDLGSDLGVGCLSLCSRALWRLCPQMVLFKGTLQRLAMWMGLKQREHRRASFIRCVRSSRALAKNVLHPDRSHQACCGTGSACFFHDDLPASHFPNLLFSHRGVACPFSVFSSPYWVLPLYWLGGSEFFLSWLVLLLFRKVWRRAGTLPH